MSPAARAPSTPAPCCAARGGGLAVAVRVAGFGLRKALRQLGEALSRWRASSAAASPRAAATAVLLQWLCSLLFRVIERGVRSLCHGAHACPPPAQRRPPPPPPAGKFVAHLLLLVARASQPSQLVAAAAA
ncbi:unnamed protein product [Parnassius apollo]|uniref:(apollo) hypothetical protein n=1 Tax=Parnassius apollo TaxID=110799 RepID=A0A8S3WF62_PARAO|nr:unnamed protein product [Parnassius apollo]